MVFAIADENAAGLEPTPEMLEAWEAMDKFTTSWSRPGFWSPAPGSSPRRGQADHL
jgi:hypothetical protein